MTTEPKQDNAGAPVCSKALFGAESTKIEKGIGQPTCRLMWQGGVLMQLFQCEDRHLHYLGDHYCHSTWHHRKEWHVVPGTPNARLDRQEKAGR